MGNTSCNMDFLWGVCGSSNGRSGVEMSGRKSDERNGDQEKDREGAVHTGAEDILAR